MRRFALCGFAALVLLAGCRKDISGSYLTSDKETVCWLQLVRTPDNHLTGQIVFSFLKPDGQIELESRSLTGAVNGENFTLQSGSFLGMSSGTLSGIFNGNSITLAGAQLPPGTLKRATLADYQAQVGDQNKRAQAIISEKAATEAQQRTEMEAAEAQQRTFQIQQNFVAEIDRLIDRMQHFDSEADVHLGRFPNAEKSYEAITAKIAEYVSRERQLAGNSNASNYRAQLVNAATRASLVIDQMHFQTQSLESSLETNITPLVSEDAALERSCHESEPASNTLTPEEVESRQNACNRLLNAAPLFHQRYADTSTGLNHMEEVYKREKTAQEGLLATAQSRE
ncbi:MAG: hypothetical protein WA634_15470 [Silvibacterium sp.]